MVKNIKMLAEKTVKSVFNIDDDTITNHSKEISAHVLKYLENEKNNTHDSSWTRNAYQYYTYLDNDNINMYTAYGADKAGVRDIKRFLSKFGMTVDYVKEQLAKYNDLHKNDDPDDYVLKMNNRPTFVTPDKQLVITVSNPSFLSGGYFHYLGVTGSVDKVHEFVYYFEKLGYYSGSCYGGRDYI